MRFLLSLLGGAAVALLAAVSALSLMIWPLRRHTVVYDHVLVLGPGDAAFRRLPVVVPEDHVVREPYGVADALVIEPAFQRSGATSSLRWDGAALVPGPAVREHLPHEPGVRTIALGGDRVWLVPYEAGAPTRIRTASGEVPGPTLPADVFVVEAALVGSTLVGCGPMAAWIAAPGEPFVDVRLPDGLFCRHALSAGPGRALVLDAGDDHHRTAVIDVERRTTSEGPPLPPWPNDVQIATSDGSVIVAPGRTEERARPPDGRLLCPAAGGLVALALTGAGLLSRRLSPLGVALGLGVGAAGGFGLLALLGWVIREGVKGMM